MKKLFLLIPLLCLFSGCGQREEAIRAATAMEIAAVNYAKNTAAITDRLIVDIRDKALSEVDAEYEAAIKSVTKPDGSINAATASALMKKKLERYTAVYKIESDQRQKYAESYKDVEYILQYSAALKEYFAYQQSMADTIDQATEKSIEILKRFLGGKQ